MKIGAGLTYNDGTHVLRANIEKFAELLNINPEDIASTERAEKEALKVYERHYGDIQTAITKIEEDRKKLGIKKYLDFAVRVNKQQKIMPLWDKSD